MRTRDGHQLQVTHGDDLAIVTSPAQPEASSPAPPRRLLAAGLIGGLVLALLATLLLVWATAGDDEVFAKPPAQPAADQPAAQQPATPEALTVTAEAPQQIVAGSPAKFVVDWADGSGVFSGSSEDWGDGVGTSSVSQGRCPASATQEKAASGSFGVKHTWADPGTYTVVLGVTTSTCSSGAATMEDAAATLTVQVVPAG